MKKIFCCILTVMVGIIGNSGIEASSYSFDEYRCIPRCGNEWNIFGDLLVWRASQETEGQWANVLTIKSLSLTEFEGVNFAFDWDAGFRLGAGYQCNNNSSWDVKFYWTRYHTDAHDSIGSAAGQVVTNDFFAGFISEFTGADESIAISADIQWALHYDMLDLELGHTCCITPNLFLRPFLGLKGGWINQSIHSQWENILTEAPFTLFSSKENLRNDFWGIGPSAGVYSRWNLLRCGSHCFSLLGNASTAMMWGTWGISDKYSSTIPQNTRVPIQTSHLGALMLQGFLGCGWETDIMQGRYHVAARLGYEMQIWFNQLRIPTFQQLMLHGDLTLQGGTFNFSIAY